MESSDSSSAAIIITLGIVGLMLLAGAAFFLLAARAPMAAPAPPGTVVTSSGDGYAAAWKSATQGPDRSWTLVMTLTRGGMRKWDTLQVSGEVIAWRGQGGPWPATLATKIAQDPAPDSLDVSFTTGPIDRRWQDLGLQVKIDSSYRGISGAGNSSSSGSHRFPEPVVERRPGK